MIDLSTLQNFGQTQGQLPTQVKPLDSIMGQLTKALSHKPLGTHYQPSNVVMPEVTASGGHVPTVRRYTVVAPNKIAVPHMDNTGPTIGRDSFLEGDITEADLIAARANVLYLIEAGIIVENGYMRL